MYRGIKNVCLYAWILHPGAVRFCPGLWDSGTLSFQLPLNQGNVHITYLRYTVVFFYISLVIYLILFQSNLQLIRLKGGQ